MYSILKKEFRSFFTSLIAYVVVGFYLLVSGLSLWLFKGDYNVFDAGYADVNSFFYLSPWLFLFLIPAITMRSFTDELSTGTIEILKTKPITDWEIVIGKFLASLLLVVVALLPTLLYVYTVYELANPIGNVDLGSVLGSYIGLFFLASTYTAIGICASIFLKKQISAFIVGVFVIFIIYFGFDALGDLMNSFVIKKIGINEHYKSISRGVVDTRDIIYFLSCTVFFLLITKIRLTDE